ncbi:hypothetical protein GCM10023340_37270 [Nocardioides marinquilinus]|uniref:Uncharacterized protein n=1 Tax=Nocardioides marinquilinus TaxID=1210400 RepID=A0ABP9PY57_9ACTN
MTDQHDHPWPGPLVVGACSTGSLAFVPEGYAVGAAAELDGWRAATTWREARELARTAEHLGAPFHLDDLEPEEDGEAAFDVREVGVVADGDWPPMSSAVSLELVERYWPGRAAFAPGSAAETVLNGPYLEVDPAEEAALVAELERAGCTVRIDHDLMRRAGQV